MLYGNKEEVIKLYREALYKTLFAAWDVVKPSAANTAAQLTLTQLANDALEFVSDDINVTPSHYPLHGVPELKKLPITILEAIVELYGKPILPKKQALILKSLRANMELPFNSIPRTKKDLQYKYPELFPAKRQPKKR